MSNVDYKGSVTLISGLTQANNGSFPLVDGDAVQYKQEINEDGTFKSVSQKLSEFNRFYEYATSDDIDGILNGLFGQWKRLSLTEDTMLENTFEDQLKILSVNGNSYQPTSNNVVPTPEKSIPIISKKTNIKRISPNIFNFEKESDISNIPDSGTYRSIGQYQLKANTKYIFSWSEATVPAKGTLSFQIQDEKGTVLVSPFTYFNLQADEKKEAGKEVEFTTTSSGIIKFAYNCTVGASSTTETYQQYWYTKILKDITLKENTTFEPEYVELRSLKESKNLFDKNIMAFTSGTLNSDGTVGTNASYAVSGFVPVGPSTQYTIKVIDGFRGSTKVYYDINKQVISNEAIATFTTPSNCYFVRWQTATTDTRVLTEEDIQKINDEMMMVKGDSLPSSYVAPTVRDYKIVDHTNKTSKIVRNVGLYVDDKTGDSWDVYDLEGNYKYGYLRQMKDMKPSNRIGSYVNVFRCENYANLSHKYALWMGINNNYLYVTKTDFTTLEEWKTWLKNNDLELLYPLATPVEESIVYVETDVSEVGYSWQDTTSPSPDIPSEIKGVEKIDILKTGKNLFDLEKAKDIGSWDGGVPYKHFTGICFKPNTTYTFSVSKNNMYKDYKTEYNGVFAFYIGETKNTANPNILIGNTTVDISAIKNKYTFTTTEKPMYFNLYVYKWNAQFLNIVFEELLQNIQIEVGDTATDYEPYKPPQFLSYQLATPLKGINNTKDIIDIESNQRTDNLTTFVLDDKTIKSIILGTTKEKTQVFQLGISDIFNNNDIWCDKLKNDSNKDEELFTCQSGELYIAIYKGRLETVDVDGFKKWLKDNPLTFTGSATTPTQEALPEDLPTELNKLKTNDGSTAIYINGEVKPSLNIEYKGT